MSGHAASKQDGGAGELFVAAVEAIYTAASQPHSWCQALDKIAAAFEARGAMMLLGREDGSLTTVCSPSLEALREDYEKNWWRDDIRTQRWLARHYHLSSDFFTDRDLVSAEEIGSHPFYATFLAKYGLRWCIGGSIAPYRGLVVALTVQRGLDKSPFSDAEIERFARLGRHAEAALKLTIQL